MVKIILLSFLAFLVLRFFYKVYRFISYVKIERFEDGRFNENSYTSRQEKDISEKARIIEETKGEKP